MIERQTWFGPPERPLFGFLAVPDSGTASLGVVLCPPMAEEARATHRTFRTLATRLAERGILAVRFDYDGTGDSAGELCDADRLTAWLASVQAAAQLLRDSGVTRIAAVGMRLGATLAASWGTLDEQLEALVLWDPCQSGTSFLREGQALHAMGDNVAAPAPADVVDTPGFRFTAETAAQLRQLDLATLSSTRPLAGRTLVLMREGRSLPKRAIARLALDGDRLEWDVAVGQADLLDVLPSDSRVPLQSLERIVAWIAESDAPELAVAVRPPVRPEAILRAPNGVALRERAVRFGSVGLFGVETRRADGGDEGRPWVVLVNVAAEQHIGPGRKWVEFARLWAGLGFRCVRLDQSGVGDSPTHPGQPEDVIFAPEWLADLPEVVDELRAQGAPVALVGLCSGAYSAMEAALVTKVDAICALNPRVSLHEMSTAFPLHDARRKAARPPIAPIARIWPRRRVLGGAMWRIYRQLAFWHAPMSAAAAVVAAGTDLAIIAEQQDSLAFREVLVWRLRERRVRRTGRFAIQTPPQLDHSLLTWTAQQIAQASATDYLLGRYGSSRVASAGPRALSALETPTEPVADDLPRATASA